MDRIKFFKPEYFNLLWTLLAVIFLMIISLKNKSARNKSYINEKLHSKLIASLSKRKIILKKIIQILILLFIIAALVGPQIGSKLVKLKRQGIDIVVAVDLSKSMLAQDITPSRLKKTKHEIRNFINKLEGDRIALVGFTSKAFIQCPLTTDYDAALMFLDIMDTSLLPQGGTSLAEAIKVSGSAFSEKEKKHKLLIVISDGEDHEHGISEAVAEVKEKGVVVYTIGIGSIEGVPIPVDNGFLKDDENKTVISKLNELDLKKIAAEGNGNYYYTSTGEADLGEIFNDIGRLEKKEYDERTFKDFEHRFQIFLMFALSLLFLDLFLNESKKELNQ
ncbi:MAG: VWA domain-containing protein [Candidatus Delongbacteria bacterium]|nr:VWA domain-containing protein [Candidatus Delongbacteria bacterium]MCG2760873.1 VWA domain-containing protein [Candidatus Delongbacteria bacterium]